MLQEATNQFWHSICIMKNSYPMFFVFFNWLNVSFQMCVLYINYWQFWLAYLENEVLIIKNSVVAQYWANSMHFKVSHVDKFYHWVIVMLFSCLTVSDSQTPWTVVCQAPLSLGFPSKNTGGGCHFLLQGIFPIQGLNWSILHWQADSSPLSHLGSPKNRAFKLIELFKFTFLNLKFLTGKDRRKHLSLSYEVI